ncbi:hypothetical protein K6119_14800 [Paracrocinitomix mangrovi]|uniref:hypothetical protein n=1 Tax=Paracrocinitomix mangrovi TaxID=2862509 RepID=UPI001C8DE86F|nr:hypothetical protein [Paracrocinitomix mangrovi]UKN01002.1 hypothetical protein K6119_14800 [Paracrocinitomix mangrovi]
MSGSIVYGQEVKFVASDTIKGKYDHFSVDNFGRIYLTSNDVLLVLSADLDTLFTSSLKAIRPSSVEASKSFRTLIFDKERSVIQFLDNTGTPIQDEIDLVGLDIQQPILVCESFGGNTIWILDAGNLRLIKLNQKLEKVIITENLTNIFDAEEEPVLMKESNDNLMVLIPGKGIAMFDVFGTYVKTYPCDADYFDATEEFLFIKTADQMEVIPLEGLLEPQYKYSLPKGVNSFQYTRNHLYLLQSDQLIIGNYKKAK